MKEVLIVMERRQTGQLPEGPRNRGIQYQKLMHESQLSKRRLRYWLKKEGILDRVQLGRPLEFNMIPVVCPQEVMSILENFRGIKAVVPLDTPMGLIQ